MNKVKFTSLNTLLFVLTFIIHSTDSWQIPAIAEGPGSWAATHEATRWKLWHTLENVTWIPE